MCSTHGYNNTTGAASDRQYNSSTTYGLNATWADLIGTYKYNPLFYMDVIACVLSLYFFVVLSIYEWKVKNSRPETSNFEDRKLLTEGYKDMPRLLSLIASFALLTNTVYAFVVSLISFVPPQGYYVCGAVNEVSIAIIPVTYFFLYIVIWVRQRSFYINELLRHLTSAPTRFLSAASFILLLFFIIVYPVTYFVTVQYAYCESGCTLVSGDLTLKTLYPALIVCMVSFHCITTFLFAYPICKSRYAVAKAAKYNKRPRSARPYRHIRMVKRYLVISILSMIVDICAATSIFMPTVPAKHAVFLGSMIAIFILTQVGSSHWRELLFPWYTCRKKRSPSAAVSSTQTMNPALRRKLKGTKTASTVVVI